MNRWILKDKPYLSRSLGLIAHVTGSGYVTTKPRQPWLYGRFFLVSVLCWCHVLNGAPVSQDQVLLMAEGWRQLAVQPLGNDLGQTVSHVQAYQDKQGKVLYYVVEFDSDGFVISAADDGIEPVIAFMNEGQFDPSPDNPLGALVSRDLPLRIQANEDAGYRTKAGGGGAELHQEKWIQLMSLGAGEDPCMIPLKGTGWISDICVAPLAQTHWGQRRICTQENAMGQCQAMDYCYNLFTPNHYASGCVATAMAQLMRYHQHPAGGIGVEEFDVWVDEDKTSVWTRGGDSNGGPYNWNLMPNRPGVGTSQVEREAIGALCFDAGVSVHMSYEPNGSGAPLESAASVLCDVFGYAHAVSCVRIADSILQQPLGHMVNPNLDAGFPVMLGISEEGGNPSRHAVLADGYGYHAGTLYHHINMGWNGDENLWYNLPDLSAGRYDYQLVLKCVYNVYPTGAGEIMSGRVTYGDVPLMDIKIVATGGGQERDTFTNSRGIYAFDRVAANTTYTLSLVDARYQAEDITVTTGRSRSGDQGAGNRWKLDFLCQPLELGSVIYVDDDAPRGGTGANWQSPLLSLQDALAFADQGTEIRVAGGVYKPDYGAGFHPGDRDLFFELKNGVVIKGGYAGYGNLNPNKRDWDLYETILSGDLEGNDDVEEASAALLNAPSRTDNSFHVVMASNVDHTAMLEGFTIEGGNTYGNGGGLFNMNHGTARIRHCTFRYNAAAEVGGGVCMSSSYVTLEHCDFQNNYALHGGAIWNHNNNPLGAIVISSCSFHGNRAERGGAMSNRGKGKIKVNNCDFSNNVADKGGAIANHDFGTVEIRDCTFASNWSRYKGGALLTGDMSETVGSLVVVDNCSFEDNEAESGAGMATAMGCDSRVQRCWFEGNRSYEHGAGMYLSKGDHTVSNCQFQGNTAEKRGGGLYIESGSLDLHNCALVNRNLADEGGGLATTSSHLDLVNCTIEGNDSRTSNGQQVWCINASNASLTLGNSIVWSVTGTAIHTIPMRPQGMKVDYSCVPEAYRQYGRGNISANPMTNVSGGLMSGSPCIDAGGNGLVPNDDHDIDQDGSRSESLPWDVMQNPRFLDEPSVNDTGSGPAPCVDIGAFEYRPAGIIYVDDGAPGSNDGSSWQDAYRSLQDALLSYGSSSSFSEIRVAQGTYYPDRGRQLTPGDREASFGLSGSLKLWGGYAGYGLADPDARDTKVYRTILSGDLKQDDVSLQLSAHLMEHRTRRDNSYHVVKVSYASDVLLDGFTINGGHADGSFDEGQNRGAGALALGGGFTVRRCTFHQNTATNRGGAVCLEEVEEGEINIINCQFVNNASSLFGGGVFCAGRATAANCLFNFNWSGAYGGGWYSDEGTEAQLVNCTFVGNIAQEGNSIINAPEPHSHAMFLPASDTSNPRSTNTLLANCILYEPDPDGILGGTGSVTCQSCCLPWGWPGPGSDNIERSPEFVDRDGVDGIRGNEDDNFTLLSDSPCIDAGDNSVLPLDVTDLDGDGDISEILPLDLKGKPRHFDAPDRVDSGLGVPPLVDIGAYEYQGEESPATRDVDLFDLGEPYRQFEPRTILMQGDSSYPLTIWSILKNEGTEDSGSFKVRFYLSKDAEIQPSDSLLGEVTIPSIPADQIFSFRWEARVLESVLRYFWTGGYVGWIVDADDAVGETDELNNTAYKEGYRLFANVP